MNRSTGIVPTRQRAAAREDRRPLDLRAAAGADQRGSREAGRDERTSGSCSGPASASGTSSIRASRRPISAKEAAIGAMRAGRRHAAGHRLHRRRHDDAGHDLPEHGLPAAAQDRRDAARGASTSAPPAPGFTYALTTGDADGRERRARPRAGRRRRRDVEHHRLHAIARRACCSATAPARSCSSPAERGRAGASSTSRTRSTAAAGRRCACRRAAAACRRRTRPSTSACTTSSRTAQTVFKFAVRKTRGDLPARARAQRPRPVDRSTCSCRTRPTAASSQAAAERLGLPDGQGRHQPREVRQHDRRHHSARARRRRAATAG